MSNRMNESSHEWASLNLLTRAADLQDSCGCLDILVSLARMLTDGRRWMTRPSGLSRG